MQRVRQWLTKPQGWITIICLIILALVIFTLIDALYFNWNYTGFGPKTLWDWLDLLIVPVALGVLGYLYNRTEKQAEREQAEKRAQTEREIARDDQREAALQSYLDRMAELLLAEKGLRTSQPEDEIRSVARSRTLSVFHRLDPDRRGIVVRFLHESNLIGVRADYDNVNFFSAHHIEKDKSIIDVSTANLVGAQLTGAHLLGAYLPQVNLSKANLEGANLSGGNLAGADLSGANLEGVVLYLTALPEANLRGANLCDGYLLFAYFYKANLEGADLEQAFLSGANLSGANLSGANLSGADLSGANLSGANISGGNLEGANLEGANLRGAVLTGANLTGADITDATVTEEQLRAARGQPVGQPATPAAP